MKVLIGNFICGALLFLVGLLFDSEGAIFSGMVALIVTSCSMVVIEEIEKIKN